MENSRKATEMEAGIYAAKLLGSYMQQPPDPKTMHKLVTQKLTNRPIWLLEKLISAESGLAVQGAFFSLSALAEYVDWCGSFRSPPSDIPRLPHIEEDPVSPEEREARYLRLKEVAQVIRETVKAKCVGRPSDWRSKPVNNPEALLEAINSSLHENHVGVEKA